MGFGCWGIGGEAYGKTRDEVSRAALRRAVERGINFFDTSGLYGEGRSERLVGELRAEAVTLATKAGYVDASGRQDFSWPFLEAALQASQERLGRIDLFQLHDPPPEVLLDQDLWGRLLQCRQSGRVGAVGASLRRPADARLVLGVIPLDSLQLNFSLVDQRARLEGLFEDCAGVALIARTPLGFGYLAGAQQLDTGDHRWRFSPRQRELWDEARDRFSQLLAGDTPAQQALRFCLAYPAVRVAIPGMLTPEQVEENSTALLAAPLEPAQRAAVEALYAELTLYESNAR